MQQTDFVAEVLLEIKNALVYRMINNTKYKITEGEFKICYMKNQNLYFIQVKEFYYTIQKQIPFIIFDFETQKEIIFPHTEQGFNVIVVSLANDNLDKLQTILETTGTLLSSQLALQNQQLKQQIDIHAKDIFKVQMAEDSAALYYIQKGGNLMKQGFTWIGGLMAKGVNKGGEFIQQKIGSNNKEVKVSDSTKNKFDTIKSGTKKTVQVAGNVLNQLITPIAKFTNEVITDVSQKIDNSNSDALKTIKQYTKTTSNAVSDAFSGLTKGAKNVGDAVGSNTRQIVEKKYGQDASNTFLGQKDPQQQVYQQYVNPSQNQVPQTTQPSNQAQNLSNQVQDQQFPNKYPDLQKLQQYQQLPEEQANESDQLKQKKNL